MKYRNFSSTSILKLILAVFFASQFSLLSAQSPHQAFEKVFNKYAKLENLSLEMEARSFEREEMTEGKLVFSGTFKKKGESYYTKAWGREMIVNNNKLLVVNHDDEKIAIGRSSATAPQTLNFPSFAIDSLVASGASFDYLGFHDNLHHYSVKTPEDMIFETEVFINTNDIITKMVYHYQDKAEAQPAFEKMVINYRNISFSAPPSNFFDQTKFLLRSKDGELVAAPRYKKYLVREVNYNTFSDAQF